MKSLSSLAAMDENGSHLVVVETPKGSSVKFKHDPERDIFLWSRQLPLGVVFPNNYGFIPGTVAGDREPVDALVLGECPLPPGIVIPSRIVGSLRVIQNRGDGDRRNDRVIAVPARAKRWAHVLDIDDLPSRWRDELVEFFRASLALTGKVVRFDGFASAQQATDDVAASRC